MTDICSKCGQEKEIVCTVDGELWCEECFDKAMGWEVRKVNDREAIEWFENELEDGKCSEDCIQCNANERALEALREREERQKGCDVCRWKDRHQKCSCCVRNRNLKDCFEQEE